MNNTVVLVQTKVGLLDQVKNLPAIPLSLITVASNLVPEFKVKIIDQRTDKYWKFVLQHELNQNPVLVGVTAMLGEQITYSLEVLEYVKAHSNARTVWGGSQGSIMPEITVKHQYIDYLIQGDGEEVLPQLARAIANGKSTSDIPGVWTKYDKAKPYEQVNLNEQKMPLYDYYGKKVWSYMPDRFGYPTLDIETSRGCLYRCAFCYQEYLHHGWRALDVDLVKERILYLNQKYDVNSFWFIDDEFFINQDRAKEIVEFMYAHNFKWSIQGVTIRSTIKMDKDYLGLLKKSGCKQLNLGVESGSPRILKMIRKPITPEEVLKVNLNLKEAGIIPSYYFIVGFPDETKEDFYDTLNLVSRLLKENPQAKIMNIGTFSPYPNCALEKRCLELGYKPPENLEDYANFGVDHENLPWQIGNRDIIGANFCNYFLDHKIDDLKIAPYLKTLFKIYQPVAKWRFNHKYFNLPLDIKLGNAMKVHVTR
jgi:radical SAM superfamily enzyme YgiQ (UPF0313 family)